MNESLPNQKCAARFITVRRAKIVVNSGDRDPGPHGESGRLLKQAFGCVILTVLNAPKRSVFASHNQQTSAS